MKSTELRIGNLILHDLIVKEVIAISKDDIVIDGFAGKSDSFQPIQLTEEWLLKFGFELKRFYEKKYPSKVGFIRKYTKNNLSCSVSKEGMVYYNFKHLLIKSVHQLQNLYFALTKTELEIK